MDGASAAGTTTAERLAEWARKGARGVIRGGAGLAVAAALSGAALLHEDIGRAADGIRQTAAAGMEHVSASASSLLEEVDHMALKPVERLARSRLAGPATAVQAEHLAHFRDLRARFEADFPQDAAAVGHIEPYGGDGRAAVLSRASALGLSKAAAAILTGDQSERDAVVNYQDLGDAGGVTHNFGGRGLVVVPTPTDAQIEDPKRPGHVSESARITQERTFWHETWHAAANHRGWTAPEGKDYGNWQEVGAETFEILMAMRDHPDGDGIGGGRTAGGAYARYLAVEEMRSTTFKTGSKDTGEFAFVHYAPEALSAVQQAWAGRTAELRGKSAAELADEARRLADIHALTEDERISLSVFGEEIGGRFAAADDRGRADLMEDVLRSSSDPAVVRAAAHAREALTDPDGSIPEKGGHLDVLARGELALADGAMPLRMALHPGSNWPAVERDRLDAQEAASLPKFVRPADIWARHDPGFAKLLAKRDAMADRFSEWVRAPYSGTDEAARTAHDAPFAELAGLNARVQLIEEAVFSDSGLSAELARAERAHSRKFLAAVERMSKARGESIDLSRCSVLPNADGTAVEAGCSDQEGKWTAGLQAFGRGRGQGASGASAAAVADGSDAGAGMASAAASSPSPSSSSSSSVGSATPTPADGMDTGADRRRSGTPWNLDATDSGPKDAVSDEAPSNEAAAPSSASGAPQTPAFDLDSIPDKTPFQVLAERASGAAERVAWWAGGLSKQTPKAESFMPRRVGLDLRLPEGAGALALPVSKEAFDGSLSRLLKGVDSGRLSALAEGSRRMAEAAEDPKEKDAFELGRRAAAKELSGRGILLSGGSRLSSEAGAAMEAVDRDASTKPAGKRNVPGDERG